MAKKAKRKLEEEAENAFEFPEFDEKGYLAHEFEQFYATITGFVIGVVIGVAAFAVGLAGISAYVPLAVGLGGTFGGALVIRQLRPGSADYTKGDWAALGALMFFTFLGFWFLVANVACAGGLGPGCAA
jgi:hypothetical protein